MVGGILTLPFEFPYDYSQKRVLWRDMTPANRHDDDAYPTSPKYSTTRPGPMNSELRAAKTSQPNKQSPWAASQRYEVVVVTAEEARGGGLPSFFFFLLSRSLALSPFLCQQSVIILVLLRSPQCAPQLGTASARLLISTSMRPRRGQSASPQHGLNAAAAAAAAAASRRR